jgi:cytochrome c
MMKQFAALIALALPLYALPAHASLELATKSKCTTCHQMDKKVLGPSFKQIAAKYKGQKNAEAMLADSMLKGAKGKWGGKVPMPAQKITPADAQKLSKWILSL